MSLYDRVFLFERDEDEQKLRRRAAQGDEEALQRLVQSQFRTGQLRIGRGERVVSGKPVDAARLRNHPETERRQALERTLRRWGQGHLGIALAAGHHPSSREVERVDRNAARSHRRRWAHVAQRASDDEMRERRYARLRARLAAMESNR